MNGLGEDVIESGRPQSGPMDELCDTDTLTLTSEEHGLGKGSQRDGESGLDSEARRLTAQFEARAARREAEFARRSFHGDGALPSYGRSPYGDGRNAFSGDPSTALQPVLEPRRGYDHISREDEAVARLRSIAGSLQQSAAQRRGHRGEVRVMGAGDERKFDWASVEAPSREDIEALAADAYAALPQAFRALCNGVAIMVRDFADDEVLDSLGVENEFDLLGLYEGIALTEASHDDVVKDFHRIFLYRRPILDYWLEHHESLGAVITHVLVHEIGHHFGLSDADMEAIERSVR